LFHPKKLTFEGYRLVEGGYQGIKSTEKGWRWSQILGLYLGIHKQQLRYFTVEGEVIPTDAERAEQEQHLRQQEQYLRQQAQEEVKRLRQRLQDLGIDP
jgi:hypothetical protein